MAVTKMAIKDTDGLTVFNFTYPSSDVFLKERNYFVFEGIQDDTYIKTVKIGDKTLNFGRYFLNIGDKFYLDVSAYYAKYFGKFNVVIMYENNAGDDVTTTVTINTTTYDCYAPFKEIMPKVCGESGYSYITPPNRMLYGVGIKSIFAALRQPTTSSMYGWSINGGDVSYSDLTIQQATFVNSKFDAKYVQMPLSGGNVTILNTVERYLSELDTARSFLYVTWRTRWGLDVSHVFYLDTYATDKDNAQEVESEYYYKEHSKHVIKGSFYLDNIREPYDLWYYQTLAQSELVVFTFDRWDALPNTYMPNGTNAFNGVKITGCNIKDAVVDGVAQSTITFDFEMR